MRKEEVLQDETSAPAPWFPLWKWECFEHWPTPAASASASASAAPEDPMAMTPPGHKCVTVRAWLSPRDGGVRVETDEIQDAVVELGRRPGHFGDVKVSRALAALDGFKAVQLAQPHPWTHKKTGRSARWDVLVINLCVLTDAGHDAGLGINLHWDDEDDDDSGDDDDVDSD